MADIYVELDNKFQKVSKQELFELANEGKIDPETRLLYDKKSITCGKVKGLDFKSDSVSEMFPKNSEKKGDSPIYGFHTEVLSPASPVKKNPVPNRPENNQSEKMTNSDENNKKIIMIVSLASVVMIVFIGLFMISFFSSDSPKKEITRKQINTFNDSSQKNKSGNWKSNENITNPPKETSNENYSTESGGILPNNTTTTTGVNVNTNTGTIRVSTVELTQGSSTEVTTAAISGVTPDSNVPKGTSDYSHVNANLNPSSEQNSVSENSLNSKKNSSKEKITSPTSIPSNQNDSISDAGKNSASLEQSAPIEKNNHTQQEKEMKSSSDSNDSLEKTSEISNAGSQKTDKKTTLINNPFGKDNSQAKPKKDSSKKNDDVENNDNSGKENKSYKTPGHPNNDQGDVIKPSSDPSKNKEPIVKSGKDVKVDNVDTNDTADNDDGDMNDDADGDMNGDDDGKSQKSDTQEMSEKTSFDIKVKKLPPHYKGHDIRKLYYEISKMDFTRNDYDTKSEHKKNIKKKLETPFMGSLNLMSTFAIHYQGWVRYNADKQQMYLPYPRIVRQDNRTAYRYRKGFFALEVTDDIEKDTYVAHNAFNAEVKVDQTDITTHKLIFPPLNTKKTKVNVSSFRQEDRMFPIRMERAVARSIGDSIGCLVVFKLNPLKYGTNVYANPFLEIEGDYKVPKYNDPKEITVLEYGIYVKDISLVYYNFDTGDIYLNITLKELASRLD